MSFSFKERILEQISKPSPDQQRQALDFVRALAGTGPVGIQRKKLLRFAGAIDAKELKATSVAIEDSCERVDVNAW